MSNANAAAVSTGVLGGLAVFFCAEVIEVPVWVAFIAWASFASLGGSGPGWLRSVSSNLVGIFWGSAAVIVSQAGDGGVLLTSVAVGVGSAGMVASSRYEFFALPSIVWGFASTVGTVAVTGREIVSTAPFSNPVAMVVAAMVIGASFGLVAEAMTRQLTRRRDRTDLRTSVVGEQA